MNCMHADKNYNPEMCSTYWNGLKHNYRLVTKGDDISTFNIFTPNDFETGNQTEKLMHYTFVFQIFVFM